MLTKKEREKIVERCKRYFYSGETDICRYLVGHSLLDDATDEERCKAVINCIYQLPNLKQRHIHRVGCNSHLWLTYDPPWFVKFFNEIIVIFKLFSIHIKLVSQSLDVRNFYDK